MPVADGLEATSRIRAHEKIRGLGPCFISALTAYASEEDRADCLRSGMDWVCTKPVSTDAVREALELGRKAKAARALAATALAAAAPLRVRGGKHQRRSVSDLNFVTASAAELRDDEAAEPRQPRPQLLRSALSFNEQSRPRRPSSGEGEDVPAQTRARGGPPWGGAMERISSLNDDPADDDASDSAAALGTAGGASQAALPPLLPLHSESESRSRGGGHATAEGVSHGPARTAAMELRVLVAGAAAARCVSQSHAVLLTSPTASPLPFGLAPHLFLLKSASVTRPHFRGRREPPEGTPDDSPPLWHPGACHRQRR